MNEPILSNFPKSRKKKKSFKQMIIDRSFDILFCAVALFTIVATILFCKSIAQPAEEQPIVELQVIPIEEPKPTVIYEEVEVITVKAPVFTDEEMIAKLVYAEANNQSMLGRVAVASVVLNRCDLYNQTVETVINSPNQFAECEWCPVTDENLRAVEIAIACRDLFPSDMAYFRSDHYHDYGEPFEQIGDHYFSCEGGE